MARAGLARVCIRASSLTTQVRHLLAHPSEITALERRAAEHARHSVGIEGHLHRAMDNHRTVGVPRVGASVALPRNGHLRRDGDTAVAARHRSNRPGDAGGSGVASSACVGDR